MTIRDLWNQLLNLDLIPIFETLALSFGVASVIVIVVVILGGLAWWLRRCAK